MKSTMRAVGVVPGRKEVRLLEHQMPKISKGNELKIRSLEVGICGTDREICTFAYGFPPSGYDYLVLGHESLGEVVEVGDKVKHLKVGDLVVPSVRRPCHHPHCRPCRAGRQDFCITGDYTERGIKSTHGFMTEFYVEDEKFLNHVPHNLRDVAVMVEPLTVAEKGLAQLWQVQKRVPWACEESGKKPGHGLNAVVLGAGPIGILGAMALIVNGFKTCVYSRSRKPSVKAELVEEIGAEYISSEDVSTDQLAEKIGNIDLVYEGVGVSSISFDVMRVLGINGAFIFTGIPAPHPAIPVMADEIMRNVVLKNQAIVGTVNADKAAFENAIKDLAEFKKRWPNTIKSLITGRFPVESYRDLLVGKNIGIKNVITFA